NIPRRLDPEQRPEVWPPQAPADRINHSKAGIGILRKDLTNRRGMVWLGLEAEAQVFIPVAVGKLAAAHSIEGKGVLLLRFIGEWRLGRHIHQEPGERCIG